MKTKPMFFTLMPFILCLIVASMPLQVALIYDIPVYDFEAIFSKLTPLNYVLMALFGWLSYATYKIDKNLFILLPFINLFVFLNNYVVGSFGEDFNIIQTTIASCIFLGLTLTYYFSKNYRIINDTKNRWWLTKPRTQLKLPITIVSSSDMIKTTSFDVSETGIFAVNDPDFELFQLPKNKVVDITIHLDDKKLKMRGKLVRKALSKGNYPEGVGIQFDQVDPYFKNWMNTREEQSDLLMAA